MKHTFITTTAAILCATSLAAGGLAPPVSERPVPRPNIPAEPSKSFTGAYGGAMFTNREVEITRSEERTTYDETPVTDNCELSKGHSGGLKCWDGVPAESVADLPECGRDYSRTCTFGTNNEGLVRVFVKGAEPGDVFEYETGETTVTSSYFTETIAEAFSDENAGVFAGYRFGLNADDSLIAGVEISADDQMFTGELSIGYALGDVLGYAFLGAAQYDGLDGSVYGIGADMMVTENWFAGLKGSVGEFENTETQSVSFRIGYNFN